MRIKGFDKDLKCRGIQFEVGKTYEIKLDKKPALCSDTVFHYCETLQQVHEYYSANPIDSNRFCEIEPIGIELNDGSKMGCPVIRVIREILGEELMILRGLTRGNAGIFNSGDRNSGDWNSGDWNSGNRNSGDRNSGNRNSGDWNSGNRNSGNRNSGDWNSSDKETGYFNTKKSKKVKIFNKPCLESLWELCEKPDFLFFDLTEWVCCSDMTDDEKKCYPQAESVGGYLKALGYKEAFQKSYGKLDAGEKLRQTELVKKLPNFNAKVFFEISGIKIK